MIEKYGAECPMQCPELFRKAQATSFRRYPYVTPDGKVFMLLGYESVAMDEILESEGVKTIYAGEDSEIPTFEYYDQDGKRHLYYPDIYIPDENRVIEVKSVYTYNQDPEKTLWKAQAVSQTHLFELRLYDNKKQIIDIIECRNGILYSRLCGYVCVGQPFPMIS